MGIYKVYTNYVSKEDFQKVLSTIKTNYTFREELVVKLMYEYGLTLEEVLGLTFYDFVIEREYKVRCHFNGKYIDKTLEYVPVLYIRNRVSDRPYQVSDKCMKVADIKQYNSREYKLEGYGYKTKLLTEEVYKLLVEYIDEAHLKAREEQKENYYKNVVADKARENTLQDCEDENYYVFINEEGNLLTDVELNDILRNIFRDCNLDDENLSEKLTNSFAKNWQDYYISEEIKLQTAIADYIYESIPGLKPKWCIENDS